MSEEIIKHVKIKSTQKFQFELGEYNLLRLLQPSMPKDAKNIKVTIDIPRGGDYSGMTLTLADIGTIKVTYELEN